MKIAVIGGAGFIGSYVVNELQKQGDTVQSFDNLSTHLNPEMHLVDYHKLFKSRLSIFNRPNIKVDISSMLDIYNSLAEFEPECIINLAGMSSGKFVDDISNGLSIAAQPMITGLINLLETAKIVKPLKFVQVSSSMVYGNYTQDPMPESGICAPINTYGALKLAAETITKTYCKQKGIEYCIVRPTSVYGPLDNNSRVIGKFITLARQNKPITITSNDEILDLTYVEDLAVGIVKAAKLLLSSNETFNMSYGAKFKLIEAIEWIKNFSGSNSKIIIKENSYYPSRGILDCTKAIEKLDFNPLIDPITGIKKYYEWHKNFFH